MKVEDDDIVHPLRKRLDTCNQFVAGSSPAAGANVYVQKSPQGDFCFTYTLAPAEKDTYVSFVRTRKAFEVDSPERRIYPKGILVM